MSNLWQEAPGDSWMAPEPDRDALAISMAHKVALIVVIVGLIVGLWALTSPQAATQSDVTLGPPMGANTHLGQPHR